MPFCCSTNHSSDCGEHGAGAICDFACPCADAPGCPEVPVFHLTPPLKTGLVFSRVRPHISPHSKPAPAIFSGTAWGDCRSLQETRIAHLTPAVDELQSRECSGNCSVCHTDMEILHNFQPFQTELLCRATCAHQGLQWAQKGFFLFFIFLEKSRCN